jgi:hypothetical protein
MTCVRGRFILIKFNKKSLMRAWETNHSRNSIKKMVEEDYGDLVCCVRLHCQNFILTEFSCGSWDTHLG